MVFVVVVVFGQAFEFDSNLSTAYGFHIGKILLICCLKKIYISK